MKGIFYRFDIVVHAEPWELKNTLMCQLWHVGRLRVNPTAKEGTIFVLKTSFLGDVCTKVAWYAYNLFKTFRVREYIGTKNRHWSLIWSRKSLARWTCIKWRSDARKIQPHRIYTGEININLKNNITRKINLKIYFGFLSILEEFMLGIIPHMLKILSTGIGHIIMIVTALKKLREKKMLNLYIFYFTGGEFCQVQLE